MTPTPDSTSPAARAWYRVAVALVFALFAAGLFHGFAGDFLWGHDGFNGAGFTNAARNSIRHGVLGPYHYFVGPRLPGPDEIYIHHPILLHLHVTAAVAIFGAHEWAARLVPIGYGLATLALLFVLARGRWGRATALAAIAIYALIPFHTIFGNVIIHEQGAIFWMLATAAAHLRFVDAPGWRRFSLVAACATMALQFAWPAWTLTGVLALHALVRGFTDRARTFVRRPELWYALGLTVVVAANAALFLGWVVWSRGSLEPLLRVFGRRTGGASGYLQTLQERALDLYGIVPLALAAAWIAWFLIRAVKRRTQPRDVVPLAFLVSQVVHSTLFRQGGAMHSYWTYYAGVGIALAGADALVTRASTVRERLPPRIAARALVTAVVLLVGYQLTFAVAKVRWGFATGRATYFRPYNDYFEQIRWAEWLRARFGPDVRYVIHDQIREVRMEFAYYLDASYRFVGDVPSSIGTNEVLLVDLNAVRADTHRQRLENLASRHAAFVLDRHFVAIRGGAHAPTESFTARKGWPSWWWRWLVDPRHGPHEWVRDPDSSAALLPGPGAATTPKLMAGGVGPELAFDCPKGFWLDSIAVGVAQGAPMTIVGARGRCRSMQGPGRVDGPSWGAMRGDEKGPACPEGSVAIGIFGRAGTLVDSVGLRCAPPPARAGEGWGAAVETSVTGGPGGVPYSHACPDGSAVSGIRTRGAHDVVALGIACAAYRGSD